MFYDTNTGMQLAMKGYSDSINVYGQKGIGNDLRNFQNQTSKALHDYRDLQAKDLENEYASKTMEDRTGIIKQQHEGMELANKFDRKSMDDRLAQENARSVGMALDNTGKYIQNNTNQMHYDD